MVSSFRFTSAPILQVPNPDRQFGIEADTSDLRVGAVLQPLTHQSISSPASRSTGKFHFISQRGAHDDPTFLCSASQEEEDSSLDEQPVLEFLRCLQEPHHPQPPPPTRLRQWSGRVSLKSWIFPIFKTVNLLRCDYKGIFSNEAPRLLSSL